MANYGPPGGNFQPPQNYGNFPGMPYMGIPPGMGGAPGMSPPPGMANAQSPIPGRPAGLPSQFQAPPNMPSNINFSASVIRMGLPQQGKTPAPYGNYDDRGRGGDGSGGNRGRMGLGADSGRQPKSEPLQPATKEEVARTVFVTGLVKGSPNDDELADLLGVGRGLRRWLRCMDADNNPCQFGFAEYEDSQSLETATKIFEDIELPLKEKGRLLKDEDGNAKTTKMIVHVDPESIKYMSQWTKPDEDAFSFQIDTAKDDLRNILASLSSAAAPHENGAAEVNGDVKMEDGAQGDNAEVITISMAAADDELSDIPEDMRESVRAEIKAFRDRSTRRDLERLRKEEELSTAERERSLAASRPSRLASPPLSAPSGPGGANSIPVGPRARTVEGAPSGPKGYRGVQMPKDYVDGVNFAAEGAGDESTDDSASDTELQRRRESKRDEELEQRYLEQKRRWMQKEKTHFAAAERQQKEEASMEANKDRHRAELMERLKNFDDEAEKRNPTHLYYKDRRAWVKHRRVFRSEEKRADDKDRRAEERELDAERRRRGDGMDVDSTDRRREDAFADRRSQTAQPAARQAFSLNLGGLGGLGASKVEEDADNKATKQSVADMEGLLDDEEDAEGGAGGALERKALRTADFKPLAAGEKMTDEERNTATRQLVSSIPSSRRELFAWPIKWDHVSEGFITTQLRPYVQKKILEALGVQEDLLVEVIESIVRNRGSPEEIMKELEVLDEEAEDLTIKVWKAVVLGSEREARGLVTSSDET